MDDRVDQQDEIKKDNGLQEKLKKLQDAGLVSDAREVLTPDENAPLKNDENEEVIGYKLEKSQVEPVSTASTVQKIDTEPDDQPVESLSELSSDITRDELTELIMPEGSTVKIKDLKLQHDDPNEEPIKNVELPEEIESLWEKTIKEIAEERESEGIPEEEIEPNKSIYERFVNRVTRKGFEIEEYSFIKHGPIVDFKLPEGFNYKEIDLYEINAPYAYVRIVHEPELHEYQYHVIEPVLTEKEKELLETVKTRLIESLDVNLKSIADESARQYLKKRINKLLKDYRINLSTKNREKIVYYITRDFVGYGEIDAMMRDTNIEDISCDGPLTPIYIYHKKYNSIPSNVNFEDDDELDTFAIRVAQVCGRHLSLANPLLDATMPDGSRIQLTLGREVTTRGSTFTIRRFNENPLTPADLIDFHTYSTAMMAYLWLAVESSKSIIFAGGTASGKTTAMNAISLFIQPEMKIVSIEDTRELNLPHPNWIPGVTREAFAGEDKGSIEMYELLRASLRQRPEYILVGEVRGAEAYVLFQAMSTGHTTFSTMHADSVQAIVHRLENPPINVPRIMIQALDVVAIQAQVKVGDERVRRCKSLTEIVGVDTRTGELLTNEVFIWNAANDLFQYSGRSYIIESVMENRGWDEVKVREELKRRQEVLDWARTKSIRHYEDISKIIVAYNREPEMIIKIVRQDLYG